MIEFKAILHVSIIVSDLNESEKFYCGILNLEKNHSRPELNFDGSWLNIGENQIHLLVIDNPDPIISRPSHVGEDRHIALQVNCLKEIQEALQQADIIFTSSKSGRRALFCRDPDGNGLEIIEIEN